MPLLSVIVLARDRAADTRRCLAALRRHTPGPLEVILYDNASGPRAAAAFRRIARGWDVLRLVRNRRNVPFAAAVNAGMRAARGEHLCWLNNDAVVGPGWREGLESALASHPRIGAAGPLTSNMAPPDQVAGRAGAGTRAVPFLGGFCLMLRRRAFFKAGPLDERFVWGWEDMDYCLRLRRAGFKLVLSRGVFVEHLGSATIATLPSRQRRRTDLANRRIFRARWAGLEEVEALLEQTPAPWDLLRPEVSAIVPVSRSSDAMGECLRALERGADGHRLETVLVGPSRAARRLADRMRLTARVVASPACTALPRAFNLGLRSSRGRQVLLVDSRGRLAPESLTALRRALSRTPGPAVVGPVSALTRLSLRAAPTEPAYLRGGCLLLERRALERLGGLDERLLWPDAEADLCLRLRRAGGTVRLVPDARVEGPTPPKFGKTGAAERESSRIMFEKWGATEFGASR